MPRSSSAPSSATRGRTRRRSGSRRTPPCEVEVLGCRERTFHVAGHHYALVHVTGLEPATTTPYEVRLDGERVWPEAGLAVSAERDPDARPATRRSGSPGAPAASSAPHQPPHSLRKDEHPEGREVDALRVLADHMCRGDHGRLAARARAARRPGLRGRGLARRCASTSAAQRDVAVPPGETVANFEEYTLALPRRRGRSRTSAGCSPPCRRR